LRLSVHLILFFASAILALAGALGSFAQGFRVGEGVTDITPPMGTELAGFHKPPGKERRSTGARQPASARALVLANTATNPFARRDWTCCGSYSNHRLCRGRASRRTPGFESLACRS